MKSGQACIDSRKFFESDDAAAQYNKFNKIYAHHYNNAYPLQNETKNSKPWLLPWLEDACASKQDLYHLSITTPTVENNSHI